MKKILIFAGGFITACLMFGVFMMNYSDYRDDALINGWGVMLESHLEVASRKYKSDEPIQLSIKSEDFPKLQRLHRASGGEILLVGGKNNAFLFFYPITDEEKLTWGCIANTKLKRAGKYRCD